MNEVLEKLKSDKEIYSFIKNLWKNNFRQFGFEHLVEGIFSKVDEFNSIEDFCDHINQVLQDKEFKRFARISRKTKLLNNFSYDIVKNYLENARSILDYGCGKMALLRRIARENHQNLKVLAGFDPEITPDYVDFDTRARFFSYQEQFTTQKFDLIICTFVLHHLSEKEINTALETMRKVLSPKGRILILEESFPQDTESQKKTFDKFGYKSSEPLNLQFSNLSTQQKMDAILLNDVLINYKNLDYMPWTNTYKTAEEWIKEFKRHDLSVEEQEYFGVIEKGRLKQGVTSLFVLTTDSH